MVPQAEFRSYYGRPVLKPPVWDDEHRRLPLPGRAVRRRRPARAPAPTSPGGRRCAAAGRSPRWLALLAGTYFLIARPGPAGAVPPHAAGGQADLADERRHLAPGRLRRRASALAAVARAAAGPAARHPGRPAGRRRSARPGLAAAAIAPALASYTAVLLSQTAVPAWHEAHRELPFVFTGSAAASAAGVGMLRGAAPPRPARRGGWPSTARWSSWSPRRGWSTGSGCVGEPYRTGTAGRTSWAAQLLTAAGGLGAHAARPAQPAGRRRVRGRPARRRVVRAARRAARRHPVHRGPEVRGRAAAAADRRARPHPYRGARWGRS